MYPKVLKSNYCTHCTHCTNCTHCTQKYPKVPKYTLTNLKLLFKIIIKKWNSFMNLKKLDVEFNWNALHSGYEWVHMGIFGYFWAQWVLQKDWSFGIVIDLPKGSIQDWSESILPGSFLALKKDDFNMLFKKIKIKINDSKQSLLIFGLKNFFVEVLKLIFNIAFY